MQADFHYYATYCAAILAGFNHQNSLDIAYSSQFVDLCSKTLLNKINAPKGAATTQLQLEMMDMRTDFLGQQEITRIWAAFHFLPYDLNVKLKWHSKFYMDKYRLMCNSNGELVKKTVELAKSVQKKGECNAQAIGIAMHVLADTWAHKYFAGTPSLVINNTDNDFNEVIDDKLEKINFIHVPGKADNLEKHRYTNSLFQLKEHTIMNLGHGRAGHLPDYSFITYRYVPSWKNYETITKNNPEDYYHAFCQMVYALKYLRGINDAFELNTYDFESVSPYKEEIMEFLKIRQIIASENWKAFGEKLSGEIIPDWNVETYQEEYIKAAADKKNDTFIGRFVNASLNHKGMVTEEIYNSGNMLAGFPLRNGRNLLKRLVNYNADKDSSSKG